MDSFPRYSRAGLVIRGGERRGIGILPYLLPTVYWLLFSREGEDFSHFSRIFLAIFCLGGYYRNPVIFGGRKFRNLVPT